MVVYKHGYESVPNGFVIYVVNESGKKSYLDGVYRSVDEARLAFFRYLSH